MKALILIWAIGMAHTLTAQPPGRHELLMTEILPDPLPVAGMPACEFIELRNVSARTLRLDGCRITDGSSTGIIGPGVTLLPDSLLILCPKTCVPAFSLFGRTHGLSPFPTIDNEGDQLVLLSPDGAVVHAMRFAAANFRNAVKADGGWSLEMIDLRFPCHGSDNWAASQSPDGGTPGRPNSVAGSRSDGSAPRLLRTFALDSVTIIALFDEGLDSSRAADKTSYSLGAGGPAVIRATPTPPHFDQVVLRFEAPLEPSRVYRLEVRELRDCHGNRITGAEMVRTGLPAMALPRQLRINEILFNPRADGADYVELLNLGPGILDAATLRLGNCSPTGTIANLRSMQEKPRLIFPGDHIVCTTDPTTVGRDYFVREPENLWAVQALPSYPDDAGCLVVLDIQGRELDRFPYRADMHFPLIAEREGVALERVNPRGASEDAGNWHSAASTSGYGTPTARNSQYFSSDSLAGTVHIAPQLFSPDLDGVDDLLTVAYRFPQPGNSLVIRVFDVQGRPVKALTRNGLAGTFGEVRWNGLDELGRPLPSGIYHLLAEASAPSGKRRVWRIPVVLARRP